MHKIDKHLKNGSVLLETILVIPLYIIILGGIMWIGDLTIVRQKALTADRYLAWNKGMMHDGAGGIGLGNVQQLFFSDANGDANAYQKVRQSIETDEHGKTYKIARTDHTWPFSRTSQGFILVDVTMPEWARMFNAASRMATLQGGYSYEYIGSVQARGFGGVGAVGHNHEADMQYMHFVLMRNGKGKDAGGNETRRNLYGVSGSGEIAKKWWNDIVNERRPY